MPELPPLSQRLKGILRKMAADESYITSKFERRTGFSSPDLLRGTSELIDKTLIRIMEEIEKGPGGLGDESHITGIWRPSRP